MTEEEIELSRGMICAIGNNVTICGGDSGSPGVCRDENRQPILCGIASWGGADDCELNYDGTLINPTHSVFVKVSYYTRWISFFMRNANISSQYWTCDNLQVIRREERCDSGRDCDDGSDEFDCARKTTTRAHPTIRVSTTTTSRPGFLLTSTTSRSNLNKSQLSGGSLADSSPCQRWSCAWDYKYNLTQLNREMFESKFARCEQRSGFLCPMTEICIPRFKLCDSDLDCEGGIDENFYDCL